MGEHPDKRSKLDSLDDLAAIAEPIPLLPALEDETTAVTAVYPTSPGQRVRAQERVPPATKDENEHEHEPDTEVDPIPRQSRDEHDTKVYPIRSAPPTASTPGRQRTPGPTSNRISAGPTPGAPPPSMNMEDRANLFSAIAESERFLRRLTEERARAERGLTTFSILLVDLRKRGTGTDIAEVDLVLSGALRDYDICCRITNDELGLILPGASPRATAAAARRLQQLLAKLDLGGTGKIPPDQEPPELPGERPDALLWVDGFPHGLPVQASTRQGRLELQANLPFLQRGVRVFLSTRGTCRNGTLKAATIVGDHRSMLRLELAP
jgi:hypothetical protein